MPKCATMIELPFGINLPYRPDYDRPRTKTLDVAEFSRYINIAKMIRHERDRLLFHMRDYVRVVNHNGNIFICIGQHEFFMSPTRNIFRFTKMRSLSNRYLRYLHVDLATKLAIKPACVPMIDVREFIDNSILTPADLDIIEKHMDEIGRSIVQQRIHANLLMTRETYDLLRSDPKYIGLGWKTHPYLNHVYGDATEIFSKLPETKYTCLPAIDNVAGFNYPMICTYAEMSATERDVIKSHPKGKRAIYFRIIAEQQPGNREHDQMIDNIDNPFYIETLIDTNIVRQDRAGRYMSACVNQSASVSARTFGKLIREDVIRKKIRDNCSADQFLPITDETSVDIVLREYDILYHLRILVLVRAIADKWLACLFAPGGFHSTRWCP